MRVMMVDKCSWKSLRFIKTSLQHVARILSCLHDFICADISVAI